MGYGWVRGMEKVSEGREKEIPWRRERWGDEKQLRRSSATHVQIVHQHHPSNTNNNEPPPPPPAPTVTNTTTFTTITATVFDERERERERKRERGKRQIVTEGEKAKRDRGGETAKREITYTIGLRPIPATNSATIVAT